MTGIVRSLEGSSILQLKQGTLSEAKPLQLFMPRPVWRFAILGRHRESLATYFALGLGLGSVSREGMPSSATSIVVIFHHVRRCQMCILELPWGGDLLRDARLCRIAQTPSRPFSLASVSLHGGFRKSGYLILGPLYS